MKIRLIGVGEEGAEVVRRCTEYFDHKGVATLLESRQIVLPTTPAYASAYTKLKTTLSIVRDGKTVNLLQTPQEDRHFRGALAWLFFDGYGARPVLTRPPEPGRPIALATDRHWVRFVSPTGSGTADDGRPADLRALQGDLFERVRKIGLWDQFELALKGEFTTHAVEMARSSRALGGAWLVTPALPLVNAQFVSMTTSIGEELMNSILSVQENHQRLLDRLGEIDCDVDFVAIAFSTADSFAAGGAEVLARAVRRVLQHPDANRIVAVLGLGIAVRSTDGLNGKTVGQYLRIHHQANGFDGLIVRPAEPDEQPPAGASGRAATGRAGTATAYAKMLAAIAMASDPKMIQVDNPDANQLQRDFGKRLFASGYADVSQLPPAPAGSPPVPAAPSPGSAMRLVELYEMAKRDFILRHVHRAGRHTEAGREETVIVQRDGSPNPILQQFRNSTDLLGAVSGATAGRRVPTWRRPGWVDALAALGSATLTPEQLGRIECATARKVIAYVGHNGGLDGAELQALRDRVARDFPRARTVVYKYSIKEVESWAGGARPAGAAPVAPPAAAPVPPPLPPSSPQFGARKIDPHFMLCVVDCFETNAVMAVWDFLERRMQVRDPAVTDGAFLDHRGQDRALAQRTKSRLAGRALLSVPSAVPNDPAAPGWEPAFLGADKVRHLSCVTDSILGGVDERNVGRIGKPILDAFGPEYVDTSNLEQEAQTVFATVKKVRVFLTREAADRQYQPEDVADLLCGLNMLCNEELDTRRVLSTLFGYVQQFHTPPSAPGA